MPDRIINGRTFRLEAVPALQGFALQPLIAPAVGRILGLVLSTLGGREDISLDTLDADVLMKVAPGILPELGVALGALKPADLVTVTRGLLGSASCDGMPVFPTADLSDRLFKGRTRDLWLLLWWAIQINYPDFLPAGLASGAQSPAATPSATSTTSAGPGPSIA